jgi:hypothetical protein
MASCLATCWSFRQAAKPVRVLLLSRQQHLGGRCEQGLFYRGDRNSITGSALHGILAILKTCQYMFAS